MIRFGGGRGESRKSWFGVADEVGVVGGSQSKMRRWRRRVEAVERLLHRAKGLECARLKHTRMDSMERQKSRGGIASGSWADRGRIVPDSWRLKQEVEAERGVGGGDFGGLQVAESLSGRQLRVCSATGADLGLE